MSRLKRIVNSFTTIDFYKDYIKEYQDYDPYLIDYSLFKQILSEFNKSISNSILEGYKFTMPFRLGALMIIKKKMNFNNLNSTIIDWQLSKKYGKVIYHLNEHSHGYTYKFYWDRAYRQFTLTNKYRFVMSRTNKRRLAQLIKEENYDYFEKI